MKEIKITEKNFKKIAAAINAVQGGKSEVRTISARDVINMADKAEKHIAEFLPIKGDRAGVCFFGGNYGKFPKAYKYTPMGTTYTLERGTQSWYLVNVSRMDCRGFNYYVYTLKQQGIISRNAISKAVSDF